MDMFRWKRSDPRCDVPATTMWRLFKIATPKTKRNKSPRMIVQIQGPVVPDEVLQIDP